jgi:hypothetical protein
MARMIPAHLRSDTQSPAERKLYVAFKEQLPDSYTVFHQVSWQTRNPRAGARDGEADFVIVHPDRGIMILEAKSGSITYDGANDIWHQNDKVMKDPFAQARRSQYSLRDFLALRPYWSAFRHIPIASAVAFTDVEVGTPMLRLDAHRDAILDFTNLRDVRRWVEHFFDTSMGRQETPGAVGVEDLVMLLSPSIKLKPLLGAVIPDEEEEFIRLTDAQFAILQALGRQRQLAVSGCAGSGKTLLAAEKARRLCQQDPKFRVLLTCFNVNLATFLAASLADHKQIKVMHFHGLCRELARNAGHPLPEGDNFPQSFYDDEMPDRLVSAAAQLEWQVDAVIVDEGQDFRENWWPALKCLLTEPDEGIFYIFYDDNQNLYRPGQRMPLNQLQISLSENCRNTRIIHDFVAKYYRGEGAISAKGPQGRDVELLSYNDTQELKRHLRQKLHHLVVNEGVDPEDIVVLTPQGRGRSVLWGLGSLGNFRLVDRPGASGEIFCTTIHQYKGLESPVVIIVELEPGDTEGVNNLLYVGASRARNHLIVIKRPEVML